MPDTTAPVAPAALEAAPPSAAAPPDAGQPPADPTHKPPAPEPRRFKAKINGREVELDEQEVIESGLTAAQIRRAAQQRFDEAQRAMAEVTQFREAFSKDPVAALRSMAGKSEGFRQAIENWLMQEYQLEQADPRDRARMEAERRAAELERQLRDREAAETSAREEALVAHYRQELDTAFAEALEKVGLPRTTEAIRRMAQLGQRYHQMGAQIDPARLARIVKQDMLSEQTTSLRELKGEALLRAIPPEVLKEIRAADIARVRAAQQPPAPAAAAQPPAAPARSSRNPNPHLLSRDEWYRRQGIDPDSL